MRRGEVIFEIVAIEDNIQKQISFWEEKVWGKEEEAAALSIHIQDLKITLNVFLGEYNSRVVALFKNKMGTVSKAGLRSRGLAKFGGEDQAINRLRQSFSTVLGDLRPEEFIEAHEPGKLRLSTHPAYVGYDKDRLLRHRNERIRKLAGLLP